MSLEFYLYIINVIITMIKIRYFEIEQKIFQYFIIINIEKF